MTDRPIELLEHIAFMYTCIIRQTGYQLSRVCIFCKFIRNDSVCKHPATFVTEHQARNHPDRTTFVGENVTIRCHSSNSKPVNWWYQPNEDSPIRELCVNGELVNGNAERFSLNTSNYDLTLQSAKWTDRGIYTCVEDTAFGTRHITHLTVRGMETRVTCEHVSFPPSAFFNKNGEQLGCNANDVV